MAHPAATHLDVMTTHAFWIDGALNALCAVAMIVVAYTLNVHAKLSANLSAAVALTFSFGMVYGLARYEKVSVVIGIPWYKGRVFLFVTGVCAMASVVIYIIDFLRRRRRRPN